MSLLLLFSGGASGDIGLVIDNPGVITITGQDVVLNNAKAQVTQIGIEDLAIFPSTGEISQIGIENLAIFQSVDGARVSQIGIETLEQRLVTLVGGSNTITFLKQTAVLEIKNGIIADKGNITFDGGTANLLLGAQLIADKGNITFSGKAASFGLGFETTGVAQVIFVPQEDAQFQVISNNRRAIQVLFIS